jgi:AraC-like DNA-binding protein
LFQIKIKDMNVSFLEYKPAVTLQPFVESYWMGNFNLSESDDFSQLVVPNGCIELIIHLTDFHCALNKKGEPYHKSPPFTLIGIYNDPYVVKFSKLVRVFGIRFYPDGFRNIFGIPPGEFLSTYEDGIDVVGRNMYELCTFIRETQVLEKKLEKANDFLIRQLNKNYREYDISHLAMRLIRQHGGLIDFKELTDKLPISLRQVQREFKNQYKLKISDYIRISRLNAINKYMLNPPSRLTELAYEFNFTDQSHFIREFKHYTGVTPKKFIRQKESFIVNAV